MCLLGNFCVAISAILNTQPRLWDCLLGGPPPTPCLTFRLHPKLEYKFLPRESKVFQSSSRLFPTACKTLDSHLNAASIFCVCFYFFIEISFTFPLKCTDEFFRTIGVMQSAPQCNYGTLSTRAHFLLIPAASRSAWLVA